MRDEIEDVNVLGAMDKLSQLYGLEIPRDTNVEQAFSTFLLGYKQGVTVNDNLNSAEAFSRTLVNVGVQLSDSGLSRMGYGIKSCVDVHRDSIKILQEIKSDGIFDGVMDWLDMCSPLFTALSGASAAISIYSFFFSKKQAPDSAFQNTVFSHLEAISKALGDLSKQINRGFSNVLEGLSTGFADLSSKIKSGFNDMSRRFDRLDEELKIISKQVQANYLKDLIASMAWFDVYASWKNLPEVKQRVYVGGDSLQLWVAKRCSESLVNGGLVDVNASNYHAKFTPDVLEDLDSAPVLVANFVNQVDKKILSGVNVDNLVNATLWMRILIGYYLPALSRLIIHNQNIAEDDSKTIEAVRKIIANQLAMLGNIKSGFPKLMSALLSMYKACHNEVVKQLEHELKEGRSRGSVSDVVSAGSLISGSGELDKLEGYKRTMLGLMRLAGIESSNDYYKKIEVLPGRLEIENAPPIPVSSKFVVASPAGPSGVDKFEIQKILVHGNKIVVLYSCSTTNSILVFGDKGDLLMQENLGNQELAGNHMCILGNKLLYINAYEERGFIKVLDLALMESSFVELKFTGIFAVTSVHPLDQQHILVAGYGRAVAIAPYNLIICRITENGISVVNQSELDFIHRIDGKLYPIPSPYFQQYIYQCDPQSRSLYVVDKSSGDVRIYDYHSPSGQIQRSKYSYPGIYHYGGRAFFKTVPGVQAFFVHTDVNDDQFVFVSASDNQGPRIDQYYVAKKEGNVWSYKEGIYCKSKNTNYPVDFMFSAGDRAIGAVDSKGTVYIWPHTDGQELFSVPAAFPKYGSACVASESGGIFDIAVAVRDSNGLPCIVTYHNVKSELSAQFRCDISNLPQIPALPAVSPSEAILDLAKSQLAVVESLPKLTGVAATLFSGKGKPSTNSDVAKSAELPQSPRMGR